LLEALVIHAPELPPSGIGPFLNNDRARAMMFRLPRGKSFCQGKLARGTGSLASRDLPNTPHHGALAFCPLVWALTRRRFCWRNIFHTFGVLVVVEFPVRRPPYGITFRTTDPGIRFEITNRWHRNTLEITNRCNGNTDRKNGGESEHIHHGRGPLFCDLSHAQGGGVATGRIHGIR
jgi:hypothetical protein